MYIAELKSKKWIATENSKEFFKHTGSPEDGFSNAINVWYQPFNYMSGAMSDFFQLKEDNLILQENKPMRGWHHDLPLRECVLGNVNYVGKKIPKWYKEGISLNGFNVAEKMSNLKSLLKNNNIFPSIRSFSGYSYLAIITHDVNIKIFPYEGHKSTCKTDNYFYIADCNGKLNDIEQIFSEIKKILLIKDS